MRNSGDIAHNGTEINDGSVDRGNPRLERVAATWDALVDLARRRKIIEYAPLGDQIGQSFPLAMRFPLDPIYWYCERKGLPPLSVLVVNKGTRLPGAGFGRITAGEFNSLCTKVFDFDWSPVLNPFAFATVRVGGTDPIRRLLEAPAMAAEVYRSVKDRGQGQILFREALLVAYGGRCAASCSKIREGLEAAHIVPWSIAAPDTRLNLRNGLLLTTWHHRMFDAGILTLDEDYRLHVRAGAGTHSKFDETLMDLDGKLIQLPRNRDHRPDPELIRRRNELLAHSKDRQAKTSAADTPETHAPESDAHR